MSSAALSHSTERVNPPGLPPAPEEPATLVLVTDQPERRAGLALALSRIAPLCLVRPGERAAPGARLGVVTDVDLLSPASATALTQLLDAGGSGAPLICLMRGAGRLSYAAARRLGADACLPADAPAALVVDTALPHLHPGLSLAEAVAARGAERTGAVLGGLFASVRAGGAPDAARVAEGALPLLEAVAESGLAPWLAAVRRYDDATYQHCLLVAGLVARFAIDLGFCERDRQALTRAALLHDVGKARVPLAILNKRGPLDPAERQTMQAHAPLGHAILVQAGGFDAMALEIVRHHHEMLDGSGYPDGLAGSEISDPVRLTTICDIYAALVERRPYKAPMQSDDALRILHGMAGLVDGDLVRAFAATASRLA